MLAPLLCVVLLAQVSAGPEAAKVQTSQAADAGKPQTTQAAKTETDTDASALLKIKRIYVESFGDDIISKELQSMIVSALVETHRFKVTENRERADAILKGVALEKTSQEVHAYGEGTSVGAAGGGAHAEISGGGGTVSGSSHGGFIARHMGTEDSSLHTETVNEARVAVRLVNPDGDVIWTTTQESKGAKYKGSSADAADKVVKQLLHDIEKLNSSTAPQPPASPSTNTTPEHK